MILQGGKVWQADTLNKCLKLQWPPLNSNESINATFKSIITCSLYFLCSVDEKCVSNLISYTLIN